MGYRVHKNFVLVLIFSTIAVLLLSGCSGSKNEDTIFNALMQEERKPIEVPYLIKGFHEYDEKYKVFIEENKNNFVRWTAHVKKVNDSKNLTLREDGYPAIKASFNYNLKLHHNIKEGDILTITGNPVKYDMNLFISDWYLVNCRIEQTSDEEKNMVLNYKTIFEEQDKKAEQEAEEKAKSEKEAKKLEKWTKDNIIDKLREVGALGDKGAFTEDTFGLGVRKHDDSADGKTNMSDSYTLVLTVAPKSNDLKSLNVMKDLTYNMVKELYENKDKIDFNISLLEIHYNNKTPMNGYANGDNFFLGINTITNYFKEPRSSKVGISGATGTVANVDFNADSFYSWIETNFTLPENNSVLTENTAWTTTSKKGSIK